MDYFAPPIPPAPPSGKDHSKPNVLRANFGDGVTQRTIDGIHPVSHLYNATWELLEKEQADMLEQFFKDHVADPFQWQPPLLSDIFVYTVLSWSRTAADPVGNETITAQFQQERDQV